ncbi:beta-N-acetylhexosaminidase [Bacteroides sp. 224]|uniref:beta-N-acetylhexosaminidase n=1 Tax=Bacteroides sp. 224 TaxID=2302936 RepID=UPI0013D640F2|nr:beta-N-acetylhexosaminidase [Bacteroides sp. 224]NDV65904.1 beta-hexosaminidase [Bacteroides sp. 224]
MKHRILFLLLSYLLLSNQLIHSIPGIIPQPKEVTSGKGVFELTKFITIIYQDERQAENAEYLYDELKKEYGFSLLINQKNRPQNGSIFLKENPTIPEEGYKLTVDKKQIICEASTPTGMFYAIQSFLQSIISEDKSYFILCMNVEDAPRYPWRGMMLDVARHFHNKETVMNLLDAMARLKMNRFHWHLTDEDGWRIEIKKYPKLTQEGAVGNWSDRMAYPKYFSQQDVKEIVEYARLRHITVIPEIDMPGHASAASRAYPEISAGGEGRWAGFTFHPAKESTYRFLEDVLTEVAELFPGPYIHIGGDEVHFGNQVWFTDPQIQKFIKDKQLGDESGLEHYFLRRVSDIVKNLGKTTVGWDEMIASGIPSHQAVIMWWRHDKREQLEKALSQGFNVVMTPRIPCYLDFVQDNTQKIGRRWGTDFNSLFTVYKFPKPVESIISAYPDQIMGMQASVWTERMAGTKRLYYMIFPRLVAISENAWSADKVKNYDSFMKRLKNFLLYLDRKGINYFNPFDVNSTPEPWGPTKKDVIAEG